MEASDEDAICVTKSSVFSASTHPHAIRNYTLLLWAQQQKKNCGKTKLSDPPSTVVSHNLVPKTSRLGKARGCPTIH